jgi:putative ABC transport system ATP-binding protein
MTTAQSTPAPALISLDDVTKYYHMGSQEVRALDGITVEFAEGSFWAIMGPSGSGKSTMLNVLGCLDRPTRGQYWLGDTDVSVLEDNDLSLLRGQRIGFVFQSFNLINQLSVLGNIEVPLFYQGVPRAQRHPRSRELAEMVGLADRADHRPMELSGGQRQRVALARALANDPMILLADEPTGNLDTATSTEIMVLLDEMHARGRTIILVTHEEHVAVHAKRTIRLRDGKVESDEPSGAGLAS